MSQTASDFEELSHALCPITFSPFIYILYFTSHSRRLFLPQYVPHHNVHLLGCGCHQPLLQTGQEKQSSQMA